MKQRVLCSIRSRKLEPERSDDAQTSVKIEVNCAPEGASGPQSAGVSGTVPEKKLSPALWALGLVAKELGVMPEEATND